jgi:hypothetical protein
MAITPYPINFPDYGLNSVYSFTTKNGIHYEVMFGRREQNPLHVTVVFGVTNEEFEGEEYVETKQHDHFNVMATMVQIMRHFIENRSSIKFIEFTGVARAGENDKTSTVRVRFFSRYLKAIFDDNWYFETSENKMIGKKKFIP